MRLPATIAAFIFFSACGILAQSTATPSASVSSTITMMPVYYLARSGELRIKPSAEAQNQHALLIQGPPSARAVPGRNATMAELAGLLQRAILNRPVIDRTGLTGRYNFDLEWADRRLSSATDPDIFGAVRQLGLKLEPAQDIVDTIVIDYSEQPTAN